MFINTEVKTRIAELDIVIKQLNAIITRYEFDDADEMKEYMDCYNMAIKMRTELEAQLKGRSISKEALLQAGVGITSLLMIMKFEKTDIITTKAFGVVTRWLGK